MQKRKNYLINIIKIVTKSRQNTLTLVISTFVLSLIYYWALIQSVPFSVFWSSNSPIFVTLQILLSIANSLIGAVSIVLLLELYRRQRSFEEGNAIQSFVLLFVSVATTGCYVCGSVLLPGLGIVASFAAMPLGGLEIKLITLLLLLYSVKDLNNKLMGTCKHYHDQFITIRFSQTSYYVFNFKKIRELKATFITLALIGLMFLLPQILPDGSVFSINDPFDHTCKHEQVN